MAQAQLNIKIDSELKNSVETILNELGVNITEAVRMFFKKVVYSNGIPFDLKIDYEPNRNTLKAMLEDEREETQSIDDLWSQYDND